MIREQTSIIDENFNLHANSIARQAVGQEVYDLASLTYVDSGLSCDTFNIIHVFDGATLSAEQLETALSHFKNRQMDYCIWINEENLVAAREMGLGQYFRSQQNEETGMVLKLDSYSPISNTKHSHIRKVVNRNHLNDYAQVIAENWTPPDTNVLQYYQNTRPYYLHPDTPNVLFNYYHENKAVATIELFPSDKKNIGIYGFASLTAYRKQGIGSALFTHALNYAQATGYQQIILQASADGIGIYQKYGFEAQCPYFEFI